MPQRNSVDFNVFVNGSLSDNPLLQPIHIEESAGAKKLDMAVLEYKGATLEDLLPSSLLNSAIEIQRVDNDEVVHWGKVTQLPILIDDGETLQLISRTEHWHLGGQVNGYLVWDPVAGAEVLIDGDLVFNPMVDGKIIGNQNNTHTSAWGCNLLLDPESVRTAAAQTLQGANAIDFLLPDAVFYLLCSLNKSQAFISNPDYATLVSVFSDTAALVQEVRIPRCTYLAQALDMLLEPLNYRWRVKRTGIGARVYEFWKAGTGGTLKSVYLQRSGGSLSIPRNNTETNVLTAGINFDISAIANEITIMGGFEEYEVTVELARCWAADDDDVDEALTTITDNPSFESYRDVWRKWVLNEAGDYIGLRTEIDGLFTSAFRTSLTSLGLLDRFIARRRQFMPTLTLKPATESSAQDFVPIGDLAGIEIEYSITEDPIWMPIGRENCALLKQECGIYFNGDKVPEEFFFDRANTRVRVTATIQGDFRLQGYRARQTNSPNTDVVPLTLDLADRFRYRARRSSLSKYGGGALPSLAVDDTTAIADFATYVRTTFDLMAVAGPIQLEGLDHDYAVSDRIEKIYPKNIPFLARPSSGAYPQIVAIARDIEQQLTILHLEEHRDVLQLPPEPHGTSRQFRLRHSSRDFV